MGDMRHHAIVCSGPEPVKDLSFLTSGITQLYLISLQVAHEKAMAIFGKTVSPIIISPINGIGSFFIAPDGSKEGWEESDTGDAQRAEFIAYLRSQYYPDSSSAVDWAEVQYGDSENEAKVVQSSDFDQAAHI